MAHKKISREIPDGRSMLTAVYRARWVLTFAAFLPLLIMGKAFGSSPQKPEALTEQKVLALLRDKIPSSRVAEIVDERGVTFAFTADVEQVVRDAGGNDSLVDALRRASQHRAATARPSTGGLIIKSTPGETEVYLNDEPRGMTSRAGELRLPGLQPGSYSVRVSSPGYSSFERSLTVAAGEPQTVYAPLARKVENVVNRDTPGAPQQVVPGTAQAIPVPGLTVAGLQFYEGPHDTTPKKPDRVYRYSFDRSSARSIYWELDLRFPKPSQRIDFKLDAVWYKPDGSQMTRQTISAYVLPEWSSSWHTLGYGYVDAGSWPLGAYRIDIYYQSTRIASANFQIN
jgi:hypothetical protein